MTIGHWPESSDVAINEVTKLRSFLHLLHVFLSLCRHTQRCCFSTKNRNDPIFPMVGVLGQLKDKHLVLSCIVFLWMWLSREQRKMDLGWHRFYLMCLTSVLLLNVGTILSMALSRMCRSPLEAMMFPCIIFTFFLPPRSLSLIWLSWNTKRNKINMVSVKEWELNYKSRVLGFCRCLAVLSWVSHLTWSGDDGICLADFAGLLLRSMR